MGRGRGPSRIHRENFQPDCRAGPRSTKKPIISVGRFTSPDTMVEGSSRGAARHHRRGPAVDRRPLPAEEDRGGPPEDIRECIGCNICISRWEIGATASFARRTRPRARSTAGDGIPRASPPPPTESGVLVVGAGPAGLECAMVLGKRGMELVHLVDAAEEPGGHLRWVSRLPGLAEWRRVIDYRLAQIGKLGNVSRSPAGALHAEGSRSTAPTSSSSPPARAGRADGVERLTPRADPGGGRRSPTCLSPEQIMLRTGRPPGERVVVYDCEGYFVGVGVAGAAGAARAAQVDVTSRRCRSSAPLLDRDLRGDAGCAKRLASLGVAGLPPRATIHARSTPAAARLAACRPRPRMRRPTIVLVTARRSDDALYRELVPRSAAGARAASRPCTGSETASRPGSSRTPSSTATGSAASSTRPIRPDRCPTGVSATCGDTQRPRRDETFVKESDRAAGLAGEGESMTARGST